MIRRLRAAVGRGLDRRIEALEARLVADAARREHELAVAIDELVPKLDERVTDLRRRLDVLAARIAAAEAAAGERAGELERRLGEEVSPLLRAIVDEEAANRRRLWRAREDPEYELAFEEPEPLVTVSVTVRDRAELLGERCLPSVLGQSYERLEVLVVGDDAPDAVRAVAEGTGDPRVRFVNVTTRVVKDDPLRQWLTAATMPRNEAYRLARGRWTLDFDDDDALIPDAIERLVEHARATRAEVPYGIARQHQPDGTTIPIGDDPPALHRFSLGAALVHGHLRFFAREHVASSLRLPGDWYRAERMLRAGVRFSRLERVVFDYYPSTHRAE